MFPVVLLYGGVLACDIYSPPSSSLKIEQRETLKRLKIGCVHVICAMINLINAIIPESLSKSSSSSRIHQKWIHQYLNIFNQIINFCETLNPPSPDPTPPTTTNPLSCIHLILNISSHTKEQLEQTQAFVHTRNNPFDLGGNYHQPNTSAVEQLLPIKHSNNKAKIIIFFYTM